MINTPDRTWQTHEFILKLENERVLANAKTCFSSEFIFHFHRWDNLFCIWSTHQNEQIIIFRCFVAIRTSLSNGTIFFLVKNFCHWFFFYLLLILITIFECECECLPFECPLSTDRERERERRILCQFYFWKLHIKYSQNRLQICLFWFGQRQRPTWHQLYYLIEQNSILTVNLKRLFSSFELLFTNNIWFLIRYLDAQCTVLDRWEWQHKIQPLC